MMDEMKPGLVTREGTPVPLTSLAWEAENTGLLLHLKCTQRYRNEGRGPIEAVYTFPVPIEAAVVSFSATLGGIRRTARAMKRSKAEETYENAVENGDSAAMVEYADDGLLTANLGNIAPGEDALVEIEAVLPLHWLSGTVRIAIPTVVAPRYSRDGSEEPLLPHQQVETNVLASYRAEARFTLTGPLAAATIAAPGHRMAVSPGKDSTVVRITGAKADSDLILLLSDVPPVNGAWFAADGDGCAACVTLTPASGKLVSQPAAFSILADCSGSMEGVSILKAQEALAALTECLSDRDSVTLSRFGSATEVLIPKPSRFTSVFSRRDYLPAVRSIEADLGGTEMEAALERVQELGPRDVLLITDGEVWDSDKLKALADRSGMRIFALGIGAAPAESVLRSLALSSGGSYEAASPTEDMREPVRRLVARMRLPAAGKPSLSWRDPALVWASPPQGLFLNDSVTLFGWLSDRPTALPSLAWRDSEGKKQSARPEAWAEATGPELRRAAARVRFEEITDSEEQEAFAEQESLLTPCTSLVLVRERTEEEKRASGGALPEMIRVPQMEVSERPEAEMRGILTSEPRGATLLRQRALLDTAEIEAELASPCEDRSSENPSDQRSFPDDALEEGWERELAQSLQSAEDLEIWLKSRGAGVPEAFWKKALEICERDGAGNPEEAACLLCLIWALIRIADQGESRLAFFVLLRLLLLRP
ncbi:VIT and VWA domain-containing protein [Mesosutterella sp. AGMB02718]|uniref:VIT and VWA domain-containing protein n=1 Tax=Mesosutterella faecium TaxID=2925194 RepID=A0ABT7IP17_9BURK|nr:VIT and VWA domain-containing protein [Mesosutterella sp. AGMB02718]MDL2060130.1 VIT and VWA domain-containing protein [Mesosutterella sp. AGMB02718]